MRVYKYARTYTKMEINHAAIQVEPSLCKTRQKKIRQSIMTSIASRKTYISLNKAIIGICYNVISNCFIAR